MCMLLSFKTLLCFQCFDSSCWRQFCGVGARNWLIILLPLFYVAITIYYREGQNNKAFEVMMYIFIISIQERGGLVITMLTRRKLIILKYTCTLTLTPIHPHLLMELDWKEKLSNSVAYTWKREDSFHPCRNGISGLRSVQEGDPPLLPRELLLWVMHTAASVGAERSLGQWNPWQQDRLKWLTSLVPKSFFWMKSKDASSVIQSLILIASSCVPHLQMPLVLIAYFLVHIFFVTNFKQLAPFPSHPTMTTWDARSSHGN